ncbi:chondroitin sulfate synthase 2 [Engraulis encrasicolus]|uniref:chondroitin sulfate synthase 2 n=1 Tax=Engraulis encrasicolus TaxID=184585 RepID=UPI002FD1A3B6
MINSGALRKFTMRFAKLIGYLKPIGPVFVGISLGFTLSLISVSWVDDMCETAWRDRAIEEISSQETQPKNIHGKRNALLPAADDEEDFTPRIIPYKQSAQEGQAKKPVRSRYASTELGIRDSLMVGVMTSKGSLDNLAVAVNRTLGHHLDTVVFFTGTSSRKTPHGMQVVTHGDERPIWNMYQTMRYILEHYIEDYNWFYLTQDDTYTQADRLKALVSHLSMDRELYLGRPEEFIGGEMQGRYCYAGFGYLLSRSLLLRLRHFLESCRNDILSVRADEWLGRCIIDYAHINCVDEYEGVRYDHFEMGKNSDLSKEQSDEFKSTLTVHPVSDPDQMYRLHKYFTQIELQKSYEEIEKLQAQIKNVSSLAFEGNRSALWPIGVNPPFEPKTRFEVLKWEFFTEDTIYSCLDGSPKCELRGIDRMDVADVIDTAMAELNRKYMPVLHLKKQQLVNGYRRFDPTRGMEYILDLQMEAVTQKGRSRSITKRVHLVRPLSNLEIIPMPYVTEATKVHIILPLAKDDAVHMKQFLEQYGANALDKKENAMLTILFIYDLYQAQHVNQHDIFADVKSAITFYERKFPGLKVPWISVKTDTPSQIKFMDIISKKHPVDTLFFTATVNTVVNTEFLNRCRMNSISNWQVFFPIHFQDFNPDIAYQGQAPPDKIDLVRDAGHFDRNVFDEACFYNSDYMSTRTRMAGDAQDNDDLLETLDIYEMFVKYSGLHVFRAIEPALHQKYSHQTCNPHLSEDLYHRCVQSNLEGLGTRSQLALILFEQEQGNST